MKQLVRPVALLLLFLVVVFGVNYAVDPANVFNDSYEETLVDILVSGKNASGVENMDDRRFLQLYAQKRTQPISTLVLGSSRTMQITPAVTGDADTFAASVTGSDLRDCISAYALYRDAGFTPSTVVLSLEFWYLSEGNLDARALTDGYEAFCEQIGSVPVKTTSAQMNKIKNFFTFPYFQSSVEYLLKGKDKAAPVPTDEFFTDAAVKRPDGTYGYEKSYREAGQAAVDGHAADKWAVDNIAAEFTGMSEALMTQLDEFIGSLQAQGIQVKLLLSPVHPLYYQLICEQREKYSIVFDSEAYYHALGEKYNISVCGSYDPVRLGLDGTGFYDELHPKESALMQYYDLQLA